MRVPALIRSCYITPSNQQDTGVITSCSGDEGILLKKWRRVRTLPPSLLSPSDGGWGVANLKLTSKYAVNTL